MCFSANMSLGLGLVGFAASGVTFLDKKETLWVRSARAYAIFHFSLMELIQYFAYPVADQCGYGTNFFLSELSNLSHLLAGACDHACIGDLFIRSDRS